MNAHSNAKAPANMLDMDGTGLVLDPEADYAPAGSIRGFRVGSRGRQAVPSTPDLDSTKGERANAHKGRGVPDARRAEVTVLRIDPTEAPPVVFSNERRQVIVHPEAAPPRPRQGWTGADPARAAVMQRPFMLRRFDSLIAQHPTSGQALKLEQPGPTASRPKDHLSNVRNPQPFAGGSTGTGAAGIGPGRNSFRIMPKAWDSLLVTTGGPAASATNPDPAQTAAAAQRARSFRA